MTSDRYARLAQQHMANYLPSRYRQIDDPESYFTRLSQEIATQVAALETTLAAAEPVSEDYLIRVGQLRAARMQAEEIVFSDLIYLTPEQPDPNNPYLATDETGGYLAGWRDSTEQQRWAPGPVFEDWEEEMWAQGLDPATGQPIFSDQEIDQMTAAAEHRRQDPTTGQPTSGLAAKATWPPPGG